MRNLEGKKFWVVQYLRVDGDWGFCAVFNTKKEALAVARAKLEQYGPMRVVRYDASTTIEVKT